MKIALAQVRPIQASPNKNIEKIANVLNNIRKNDVDLVVFPELFLTGYWVKDMLYRLAEPLSSEHIKKLSKLCSEYNVAIVAGFVELDEKYYYTYNSALLIDSNGNVTTYRKRHLPTFLVFDEARWFKPYNGPYKLWRVNNIPIGVEICYDIFFPEVTRTYALMGAKVVVGISAAPDLSLKFFKLLTRARALENTLYFIWVNLIGVFDGLGFPGGSQAVDPLGNVIVECKTFEEDIKIVNIDLGLVKYAREIRPVLRDFTVWDIIHLYNSYLEQLDSTERNSLRKLMTSLLDVRK